MKFVRCDNTLARAELYSSPHGASVAALGTARASDRRTLARLVSRALRRRHYSAATCSRSSGLPGSLQLRTAASRCRQQLGASDGRQCSVAAPCLSARCQTAVQHGHDRCEYSRHRGRRRAVRLWRRAALWPHSASSVSARACQPRVQSVGSHARAHAARSHSGATVVALLASPTRLLTALAPPLPVAGSARQAREGDQGPRPHWPDRLGDPGAR